MKPGWHKSSYSFSNGNCVEVRWYKSSRSMSNGHCVEVAGCSHHVQVRDSKDPGGPVLSFGPAAWAVFVAGVKAR